jgi:hypothetical protein
LAPDLHNCDVRVLTIFSFLLISAAVVPALLAAPSNQSDFAAAANATLTMEAEAPACRSADCGSYQIEDGAECGVFCNGTPGLYNRFQTDRFAQPGEVAVSAIYDWQSWFHAPDPLPPKPRFPIA